jgi:5'-3' exonuclease
MSYKDLLNNIKEDSQTETLHLNSRVLLVDSMNMFLRSFAVIGSTNTQGTHIGGMIGFLRSLAYTVNLVQPTRIICVFDGQGNTTNRKNLYPEYKANRKLKRITNWNSFDDLDDESASLSQQMLRLVDYLKQLPISIVTLDKLEADDMIGYLAPKFDSAVIVSADQDFLQLCSDKIQVYSPIKKKFYGPKEVYDEMGLWPQNYINYKVLMGDKSDNVPGIRGLGDKKLQKLYPEIFSEDKVLLKEIIQKSYDKHQEHGLYGDIWNFRQQLMINFKLMTLSQLNIPEYDQVVLDELINEEPYTLNNPRFLQLHKSDLLERQISPNVEFWIQNNFSYLTQYKHKK